MDAPARFASLIPRAETPLKNEENGLTDMGSNNQRTTFASDDDEDDDNDSKTAAGACVCTACVCLLFVACERICTAHV